MRYTKDTRLCCVEDNMGWECYVYEDVFRCDAVHCSGPEVGDTSYVLSKERPTGDDFVAQEPSGLENIMIS